MMMPAFGLEGFMRCRRRRLLRPDANLILNYGDDDIEAEYRYADDHTPT